MYKPVQVNRKDIYFRPDTKRVLARFFSLGDERSIKVIRRVLQLSDEKQKEVFGQVLRSYSQRHRSIVKVFERNFDRIRHLLERLEMPTDKISMTAKLLIGSYFTMEYSIESAALFNPSIVEHPDQSELYKGEKRVIISFRATGEGHVSSIVFRSGYIDTENNIHLDVVGTLLDKPINIKNHRYNKNSFISKLVELHPKDATAMQKLSENLTETFTYEELKRYVEGIRAEIEHTEDNDSILKQAIWLASSHYEMTFSLDTSISERVILKKGGLKMRDLFVL